MGPDPLDEALAALEASRRGWVVAIVSATLAFVATVVLIAAAASGTTWSAVTAVAATVLAVVIAGFLAALVVRTRRSVRATRALTAVRAARASDEARERTLGALHAAIRRVTGSLDITEVVDRAVSAVTTLAGATSGVVLLRTGEELAVAAGVGPAAAPRGTRRAITPADRAVLESGETVVGGRGGGWGHGPGTITAPLALPERVVGTLVVQRDTNARPFGEDDRLAVALLAELVAVAIRNATTHDRERQRAESFRALVGTPLDDPDGPIATTRG